MERSGIEVSELAEEIPAAGSGMQRPPGHSVGGEMRQASAVPETDRLSPMEWIEQLQEWSGGGQVSTSNTGRVLGEEFLPYLSSTATRREVEELSRRIDKLADRIQALEER